MANIAHVDLLKNKGAAVWNEWRKGAGFHAPDLSSANFCGASLNGANLSGADLRRTDFTKADISQAILRDAYAMEANFGQAYLGGTNLSRASLTNANFDKANLNMANLSGSLLIKASFSGAYLRGADLTGANVSSAEFSRSFMQETRLGSLDLSTSKGLETVEHLGPSSIGIDTVYISGGNIPVTFLYGVGVPEPFITHLRSLVNSISPIEFYSCFISYSSKDQEFAKRLHADLRSEGVRCWFAPEDLKIGDRLRPSFDEAIRVHDKLMVLLSENSVKSQWVEKEVETAFEKERQQKRIVLFPIRLDETALETDEAWAADIRRTRHIGDFSKWKHHNSYKESFDRLLRDLKA